MIEIKTKIVRVGHTTQERSRIITATKKILFKQLHQISKKLVLVKTTFALVTEIIKVDNIALNQVPCICYQIQFKKMKFRP